MDCLVTQLSEKANKAGSVARVIWSYFNCKPHRQQGEPAAGTYLVSHHCRNWTEPDSISSVAHQRYSHKTIHFKSLPPFPHPKIKLCSSIPQPYLALPFHPSSFILHQLLQKPLSTQGLGTPLPTPQDADSILLWDNLHGSQLPTPRLLLRGDTSRLQMTTTTKLQISYPHFSCLSSWKPKKIRDW